MSFVKYVSYPTIEKAGFNFWEITFEIQVNREGYHVYHTQYSLGPRPNIIVIEKMENSEELYLRSFLGKHSGQCATEEEAQPFFEKIKKAVSAEYRVKGNELERRIKKILREVDESLGLTNLDPIRNLRR